VSAKVVWYRDAWWVRTHHRRRKRDRRIGPSKADKRQAEVIRPKGPWRGLDEVEFATLEWVDWFNNRRLLEPLGYIPPAEFEAMYDRQQGAPATGAALN
jgi:transposase InsO family protein